MFRTILVPVDLTEKNGRALAVAAELARQGDGAVTMLHVIETLDAPFEELEDFYQRLEETARRRMSELGEPLRAAGVRHEYRIVYGKRAPEIVLYCRDHDVDLVVISSHRVDPENATRGFLTISHQVAIVAPAPVLVLK
jgi:universal stress protein A